MLPEGVDGGAGGAGGQRLGGGAVAGDVGVEGGGRGGGKGGEGGLEPGDPGGGGARLPLGPGGEVGPVDPGGLAAELAVLEAAGQAEVGAAGAGGAVDQRVLEQDQEVLAGSARSPGRAARRRRRTPGGVSASGRPALSSGMSAPAVELGGDAAGQRAVGGDEGGARAGLGGLAERERDGERLGALVGGLDPGEGGAGRGRGGRRGAAPSACHWSVTGAGRSASETSALRSGAGGGRRVPGAGRRRGRSRARRRAARKPCCGWSAAPGVVGAEAVPDRGRAASGRSRGARARPAAGGRRRP